MDRQETNQRLAVGKIIVLAMGMGIIVFGAVAIVIVSSGTLEKRPEIANMLLLVLGLLAATELPVYLVLRQVFVGRLQQRFNGTNPDDLPLSEVMPQFFTLSITGAAMVEGASLFGIVIMLITGSGYSLVAPAFGLAVLALLLPTQSRFDSFVERVIGRTFR